MTLCLLIYMIEVESWNEKKKNSNNPKIRGYSKSECISCAHLNRMGVWTHFYMASLSLPLFLSPLLFRANANYSDIKLHCCTVWRVLTLHPTLPDNVSYKYHTTGCSGTKNKNLPVPAASAYSWPHSYNGNSDYQYNTALLAPSLFPLSWVGYWRITFTFAERTDVGFKWDQQRGSILTLSPEALAYVWVSSCFPLLLLAWYIYHPTGQMKQ